MNEEILTLAKLVAEMDKDDPWFIDRSRELAEAVLNFGKHKYFRSQAGNTYCQACTLPGDTVNYSATPVACLTCEEGY